MSDKPMTHDRGAAALGELARSLDGTVDRAEDHAARERFLVAIGTEPRRRVPWMLLAAAVAALAASSAFVLWRRAATVDYQVSGPIATEGEWFSVAPDRGAASLKFSEGTEIDLGPAS